MVKLLTTAEVARRLGKSKSTVHRLARTKKLKPTVSNSAGDLFSEASVNAYLDKHTPKTQEAPDDDPEPAAV